MDNFKILLITLWLLFFFYILISIIKYFKYKSWIKQLENTPLNAEEEKILNKINIFNNLSDEFKQLIAFKIHRFKKEKQFIGINLQITEEMKTVISFFACLPTLNNKYFCYPSLKYIYVYPHTMIINNQQNINGIVSKETMLIEGEAIGESVIIAWDESKKEAYHNLGRNVVIHEFAHELDFEEGDINGIPPLNYSQYSEWVKIIFNEYKTFRSKINKNRFLGKYSFLDNYAATNQAEFFAVLSEYYFIKPCLLKKHFPKIYKELKKFYKIDTALC